VSENVKLLIYTATPQKVVAERSGWLDVIRHAGAYVITDSCPMHTKMLPSSTIALDSAKIVNQCTGQKGWNSIWYGSTEDCIDAAVTGKWRGGLR
jgi:hypothetical protein